ncbi:MAG: tol-pal system protein YbgF [Pseudomonadota bacterium]
MPKLKFALAVLPSLLVGAGVVAVSLPLPAQAQQSVTDTRALYDRLLRLERDLQDVQRNVYQGGAPAQLGAPAPAADIGATDAARLSLRLDQIEASLRDMTGQVERLQFELRQANQKLENFAADTDFRLRDLEGTGGGQRPSASNATSSTAGDAPAPLASSAPTPAEKPLSAAQQASIGTLGGVTSTAPLLTPPSSAPRALSSASNTGLPDGGPDVAYKYAMSFLRQGDYPSAEAAFTQFLEAYGDTSLAGNAQYWLGETYYVREQYQDAARAFLTGYQTYASSPKAPDSLLKLGITLAALGQTQDACLTLAEVPRTFPGAPQSVKARAEQERSRAGCV